jgi:hypothetical protein
MFWSPPLQEFRKMPWTRKSRLAEVLLFCRPVVQFLINYRKIIQVWILEQKPILFPKSVRGKHLVPPRGEKGACSHIWTINSFRVRGTLKRKWIENI